MPDEGLRTPASERWLINAGWLLQLRWVAVAGQLLTVAGSILVLREELPLRHLLGLIGATAATNLLFWLWLRSCRRTQTAPGPDRGYRTIAGILAIDLLSLTGLLYFSGGPANPFSVFYFVHLSLAAVILPARWSWGLNLLATVLFAVLIAWHVPIERLEGPLAASPWLGGRSLRNLGLGVALVACGMVVTHFITRVTRELQLREAELHLAEVRRARSERLESLATLAAGAGHELASPLSTIAVVAKDLARHLEETNAPASVLEDVALIRQELAQCRRILDSMASSAGQSLGESLEPVTVERLLEEVLAGLRRRGEITVSCPAATGACRVLAPLTGMSHALRGIVRNALEASSFGEPVQLAVASEPAAVVIVIRDRGAGMPPEILARAGDPFFTTKEPGQGMGLGLFLARNVIERLGGELRLSSTPGTGTSVTVRLPRV